VQKSATLWVAAPGCPEVGRTTHSRRSISIAPVIFLGAPTASMLPAGPELLASLTSYTQIAD